MWHPAAEWTNLGREIGSYASTTSNMLRPVLKFRSDCAGGLVKVVFLHGIGDGDPTYEWLTGLNRGLQQGGYPPLERGEVIAPRYTGYLKTDGIRAKLPPLTYKPKDEAASRREFERRQARVQRELKLTPGVRWFGFDRFIPDAARDKLTPLIVGATDFWNLDQVRRYIRDEAVRGAVMNHILNFLPTYGEIILVAHSLGSVIAIDLLDHLPDELHVRRFITIGSPASVRALHEGSERLLKKFPYARVDDWSNFFSRRDIVTGGRGLAALFPGAQDFEIDAADHGAEKYLGEPAIAGLVAEVLYPSKEAIPATADIVVRMNSPEASVLLMHHFAEAVANEIKDRDRATRYLSVLQLMRDDLAAQLKQRANAGQPLSFEMQQLANGVLPDLPHRWELHEAVGELAILALTNCIAPYEIDIGDAPMLALDDCATLMGFQKSHGEKVAAAIKEVQEAVGGKSGVPWGRVLTAAAGLALVAAGPIGLAVAAPAGAFGAAAIAGGLAAFGPGGMVGGLWMLGGLAGAGAAVAAAAAAGGSDRSDDGPNLAKLMLKVATERARKMLQLPYDTTLWYQLTHFESQISAALNRLTTFSDDKAPGVLQMKEAQLAIKALIRFAISHGLAPVAITDGESK